MTKKLNSADAFFLQVERPASPMHIGSLSRFQIPKGRDKTYVLEVFETMRQTPIDQPPFNYRLAKTALGKWNPAWEVEEDIDMDYHLRHSALPQPGGERELAVLISRLHSIPLDRSRPLWEFHLIEGFADNTFALYGKMHHALIDGVAGSRMIQRTLATKSAKSGFVPMWGLPPEKRRARASDSDAMKGFLAQFGSQLSGIGRVSAALTKQLRGAKNKDLPHLIPPYTAPDCVLNGPIGPQRRVSTQDFPIDTVKAIAKASKATLNDVVMAICGGALRGYLQELHALPDDPLIAQVPVNVRASDDQGGGNAISMILSNLGTNIKDPGERLAAVKGSMDDGKTLLSRMSKSEIASYSAMLMAPFAIGQVAGIGNRARKPMFNVVISNVPGPKEKLYLNNAALLSCHPVSLVFEGQALNITIFSYADSLSIIYTACRSSLPHVQHLVPHAEVAFKELKRLYKVK